MKYLSMSNEISDEMGAVKNETINEIPTDEQCNIQKHSCRGE
jgi:hypothetical protein